MSIVSVKAGCKACYFVPNLGAAAAAAAAADDDDDDDDAADDDGRLNSLTIQKENSSLNHDISLFCKLRCMLM